MKECEFLGGCPFFNNYMPIIEAYGASLKKKFCYGEKILCARYSVRMALGKENVPDDLYPDHAVRACEILKAHKTE
jgi:hypothetical protein